MSVIYAKLKSEQAPTVVLFNQDQVADALYSLFNPPGLKNSFEYDCYGPQSLDSEIFHVDLTHDQWLKIQDIYETDNKRASDLPNSGYKDQYVNIDVIYRVTDESISFKKIRPSQISPLHGFVAWGDKPVFEAPTEKVLIDPSVDLYINKSSRRAYFKSFRTASQIARVLNEFYEETTQQHAEEALSFDIFNIAEFDVADVKPKNVKRLARIKGDFKIDLSDVRTVEKIQEYAEKYERNDVFTNGRIKITSNAELTEALDVISGSYYENEITGNVMKVTTAKILE